MTLAVGDLLAFTAPGGVLESGSALEPLGVFTRSLPGPDGRPLSPQGPPTHVLFRAVAAGEALVRVSTGDPWRGPATAQVRVAVQA